MDSFEKKVVVSDRCSPTIIAPDGAGRVGRYRWENTPSASRESFFAVESAVTTPGSFQPARPVRHAED
jgi:hypothetical protein